MLPVLFRGVTHDFCPLVFSFSARCDLLGYANSAHFRFESKVHITLPPYGLNLVKLKVDQFHVSSNGSQSQAVVFGIECDLLTKRENSAIGKDFN